MVKTQNTRFLAELKDDEKATIGVFIPHIYEIVQYYCKNCKKFSEKICECGKFPEPIFRITGIITDGTRTLPFKALSENVSETLSGAKKSNLKNLDVKNIMKKPHIISGYVKKDRFLIESVIE